MHIYAAQQLHPAGLCRWHQFLSPGNWWEGTLETDPEVLQPSTNTDLPYWLTVLWLCCMGRERLVVCVLLHKHSEVHAVHGTQDFSYSCSGRMCNNPRWHTAESATLSLSSLWKSFNWTELPCLNGAGKTKWSPRDLARGGLSSPRDLMRGGLSSPRDLARGRLSSPQSTYFQICYGLTWGENALLHVDT